MDGIDATEPAPTPSRSELRAGSERRVVFLLLPAVHVLDLAGASQAFYEATRLGGLYRQRHVGVERSVFTAQGLELSGLEPLPGTVPESPQQSNGAEESSLGPGDIVVVPGTDSERLDELAGTVPSRWLARAHSAGATVCSVCTGAFALGVAGLLDGRKCTTHWKVVGRLGRQFPDARVVDDRLFVKDDRVYTSAGVASGIDLALSMIEEAQGPILAARVAREMVVYLRRDGSRGQRSVFLDYCTHLHPGVHRVQDWLVARPSANPTLGELASVAGMSPRHLTRTFRGLTGVSLKEFSHALKLEVARNLLHDPSLAVEAVATRCGFHDGRQLRRLWRRRFHTSPSAWRERRLSDRA